MEEEQIGLRQDLEEAQNTSTAVEEDLAETQVTCIILVIGIIKLLNLWKPLH